MAEVDLLKALQESLDRARRERAEYDDDRPGMMRVHIAEQRAAALCEKHTRDGLRRIARFRGVPTGYSTKHDLAVALAFDGLKP